MTALRRRRTNRSRAIRATATPCPIGHVVSAGAGPLDVAESTYAAGIATMALLSLRMKSALLPLGALLFMASDSLIALSKFLWSAPWVGPTIWITYAAAQLLIVCGLLASGEPATDRAS